MHIGLDPRRIFRPVLVSAVVAAGLAVQPGSAQALKTWRHGTVEAKSDSGFTFMAGKGGFADRQGLDLDMLQFKGDAIELKALLAGELDSYEGSPGSPMLAASHGADVKIIGCYWPTLTYGIFTRNGVNSPQDLKGKSFAISSPGALPDLLARVVLEENGMSLSDVRFVAMGSDADRYRALAAGVVDAATISTEFVPYAQAAGLKLLVHAHDAAPNYLRFCILSTAKIVAQRGDDVVRFLAAEITGLRYALANRDKVVALAKEVTEAKPDDPRAAYIFDEVNRYSAIDPDMPVPLDKLAWMQDLLIRTGNLSKAIDLRAMIDDAPRTKALALVGKQ